MFLTHVAPGLTACLLTVTSYATEPLSAAELWEARALRERALADDTAYELVRSLTTEVGPRLAGSPGDAQAVAWSLETPKALGGSIGTPAEGIEAEVVPVTALEELKAQPRERIAGRVPPRRPSSAPWR